MKIINYPPQKAKEYVMVLNKHLKGIFLLISKVLGYRDTLYLFIILMEKIKGTINN